MHPPDAAAALRRSGQLAAFLYALGAAYMLATAGQLSSEHAQDRIWAGAATAAVTAGVLLVVPWHRLPRWTSLVAPLWAFVVLAVPIGWYAHALSDHLVLYTLLFSYVGLTQRRGTALAMLPLALGTLALTRLEESPAPPASLVATVVVAVLLAEALALVVGRQRQAHASVDRLLSATAQLQSATTTTGAADVLVDLCRDLLGADEATVLRRTEPDGPVLVDVSTRDPGEPPTRLDTSTGTSGTARVLELGEPLFVPDAAGDTGLDRSLVERHRIGSALFLPLGAHGSFEGVAVAWSHRRRRRVDAVAQRAAQVLAVQAGQVLRRLREAEALEDLAVTDALTGLPNRRLLFSRLAGVAPGDALAFVDLDHFKAVNDRLGHAAGDDVLRRFARTLRDVVRDTDLAARYGGEEFAVLLPATDADGAVALLERLRELWGARQPGITFSAGVAVHARASATETLAAADEALFVAKRAGRNTTRTAAEAGRAPVVRLERRHRAP